MKFKTPTFEELVSREWLVTNGLGGFASSTLSGANSRRYHGLLVAALDPPTHRTVLVSKIEETIVTPEGRMISLSANEFPGIIHPQGFQHLQEFKRDPIPGFRFSANGYTLKKRIFMPYHSNATVIEYENTGKKDFQLILRPFFVHRDYHSLTRANDSFTYGMNFIAPRTAIIHAHEGATPFYLSFTNGHFHEERLWYYQFVYREETERGLDDKEDCFTPGYMYVDLKPGEKMFVVFSLEESLLAVTPDILLQAELDRLKKLKKEPAIRMLSEKLSRVLSSDGFDITKVIKDLSMAGDQFIVQRKSSKGYTLIAGYPWFTDWGRDTMIAMRGLVIALGKKELAESILQTFLQYLDQGMLPNRFPDQGEKPEYNTMDATLWLFVVLDAYLKKFNDIQFIERVFPSLTAIIESHIHGTRYDIHMTQEGLLYGGKGKVQLTWMDAKVGDHVVTPRHGCPVEINALWYNALMIYDSFSEQLSSGKKPYLKLAEKVKKSFITAYWNGQYLNDVMMPSGNTDNAIRPNQLYALSLPYPVIDKKMGRAMMKVVWEKLYTPLGIRSLDPDDPSFIPVYRGDQWERDHAYHQGTVWTFLLGEYWLAYLHQEAFSKKSMRKVWEMMNPVLQHFYTSDCIEGISEIFDGKSPTKGKGCIHQAWSVGMLLQVLAEMSGHIKREKQS